MNTKIAEVNAVVDAGRKEILSLMKSKGYRQTTTKASALHETMFEMGSKKFAIDGWHGTGKRGTNRWFGDSKSIFRLYNCTRPYSEAFVVVEMDSDKYISEYAAEGCIVDLEAQRQVIDAIIKYLKDNA